jgi:hypothetical protein
MKTTSTSTTTVTNMTTTATTTAMPIGNCFSYSVERKCVIDMEDGYTL